jgi:hypothetical protein
MGQKSLDLIQAMYAVAEVARPITGRGIGYKLFAAGMIPSMARREMQRVYRLLTEARERGIIPWAWIVDETRELERVSSWDDPEEYAAAVRKSFENFWDLTVDLHVIVGECHGIVLADSETHVAHVGRLYQIDDAT